MPGPQCELPSGFPVHKRMLQTLVCTINSPVKFGNSFGSKGHFTGFQFGGQFVAEIGGAADALGSEQREDRIGAPALKVTFLPFLNGPGDLADLVHRVAEFSEHPQVYATCLHGLSEFEKFSCVSLQLEIHTPKRLTRNKKLDCDPWCRALCGTTYPEYTCLRCFGGEKVSQFDHLSNIWGCFHAKQPSLCVDFLSLGSLFDAHPSRAMPLHFCGNNDGEALASSVFNPCGLVISRWPFYGHDPTSSRGDFFPLLYYTFVGCTQFRNCKTPKR